jgi:glucose/arabinose dehydrogenase
MSAEVLQSTFNTPTINIDSLEMIAVTWSQMLNPLKSSLSSVVRLSFLAILILTSISLTVGYQYFGDYNHNHRANGLDSKYPEVGLPSSKEPIINDPNLKTQVIFRGLKYPTSMAFLGPNDILVTEKDTGILRRIVNGTILPRPLLDVNVSTFAHRGMLGNAISHYHLPTSDLANIQRNNGIRTYVFLYYTEAPSHDGDDVTDGKQPLGNRLYRYELIENKLVSPKLMLDLPATPGGIGNGGKVIIGPDGNVYVTVGDVGNAHNTKAQNVQNGPDPDGTGGILRMNQDGNLPSTSGILGNKFPLNLYYSYGMWNSFGIDFDPISRSLWDTENGLVFGDEINIVEPGFNSGYNKIDGIWLRGYNIDQTEKHVALLHPQDLVDFGGRGKYHLPQFTWFKSIAPTGIAFFNSTKMGSQYEDDLFVGDNINGNIYHFKLNLHRTELLLPNGPLADKVANTSDTLNGIIFGKGFGGITDVKVGPNDGYLYVLTFNKTQGTIYRVVPSVITTTEKGPLQKVS